MAYVIPTAADLKALYPAFAGVDDATVTAWITRVNGTDVDESWLEADFAPGIMAAAAHRMQRAGVPGIAATVAASYAMAGVTDFKSGSFSVAFDADAVKRASAGGWASTFYGQDYYDLLRKRAGPRTTGGTPVPGQIACDWPYA